MSIVFRNILKDLIAWKNGLQEYVYDSSVRYKTVDVSDMEDFPQYLVEKHNTVEMPGVINQIFTFLKMMLCFAGSLDIKLVSMNNGWMVKPTMDGQANTYWSETWWTSFTTIYSSLVEQV